MPASERGPRPAPPFRCDRHQQPDRHQTGSHDWQVRHRGDAERPCCGRPGVVKRKRGISEHPTGHCLTESLGGQSIDIICEVQGKSSVTSPGEGAGAQCVLGVRCFWTDANAAFPGASTLDYMTRLFLAKMTILSSMYFMHYSRSRQAASTAEGQPSPG